MTHLLSLRFESLVRESGRISGSDSICRWLTLRQAFDLCTPICQCGETPCPQAKLKRCTTCGDIKPTVCRKGPCVAARQPLMLTMCEEALPTALPAP